MDSLDLFVGYQAERQLGELDALVEAAVSVWTDYQNGDGASIDDSMEGLRLALVAFQPNNNSSVPSLTPSDVTDEGGLP